MEEKYAIKPAFTNTGHYVAQYNENDIILEPIDKAKLFTTTQEALDFLEGFPFLTRNDGVDCNAFTIDTIYIINK